MIMEDKDLCNASKSSLFVGDLSIFCDELDLKQAYEPYGEILEAKIMRCEETNKNLCYGFVKFSNSSSAIAAMKELNGKLLCGRPMRVSWASHRLRKNGNENDGNYGSNSSSIHITYMASQIHNLITEEQLQIVFQKFGRVLDITVKKFEIDKNLQCQKGYGFVHFPPTKDGILAAVKCTEELRDRVVDGINFKCDISHKLLKQLYGVQDASIKTLLPKRVISEMENYLKQAKPKPTKAGVNIDSSCVVAKGAPVSNPCTKLNHAKSKTSMINSIYSSTRPLSCAYFDTAFFEKAGFTYVGQYGVCNYPPGSGSTDTMFVPSVDNYYLPPNLSSSSDSRISVSTNTDSDSGESTGSIVSYSETNTTTAGFPWSSLDTNGAAWPYMFPYFSYPNPLQNQYLLHASVPPMNFGSTGNYFDPCTNSASFCHPAIVCPMMMNSHGTQQTAANRS